MFTLSKTNNSFNKHQNSQKKSGKMDRNAPMTIPELDLLNFIGFLSGPPRVKYTTVLE